MPDPTAALDRRPVQATTARIDVSISGDPKAGNSSAGTRRPPDRQALVMLSRADEVLAQHLIAPRCGQGPIPADSALAPLMLVDCRLDRGFRLEAGRLVLGLGVVIAPVAELVGIALEVLVNVTRHQLVAALRRRPVRPIVRQQQDAAEATIRAFPQSLEMVDTIVRGADAGAHRPKDS